MNIYRRELKAHRKSLIIWSVSMALLVAGGMESILPEWVPERGASMK